MTERRENIARALWEAMSGDSIHLPWERAGEVVDREAYRRLADAAIAADDGAIGRVLALAEELNDRQVRATVKASHHTPGGPEFSREVGRGSAYGVAAHLIRIAVGAPATAEDGERG